ncbi:MAG: type II secretion system protein [Candidatus Berkelbacteria bacterium]|nr:type II secretion system protein [Candidatus Berkelbacteria bacterium]
MKKEKGFTLIELLVVIAIIGILAVLIFVAMGRAQAGARNTQRKAFCHDYATAEAMYYDATKHYGGYTTLRSGYLGQDPTVCATAVASCNIVASWTSGGHTTPAAGSTTGTSFSCTADLENGGTFVCDVNGCR